MTSRPRASFTVELTLLTKTNCPLCDHAKEVLGRIATDYVVEQTVLWFETPEGEAFVEKHATPFPPVLLINGELHGYGRLSERKLRRELESIGAPRRPLWTRIWRKVLAQSRGGRSPKSRS